MAKLRPVNEVEGVIDELQAWFLAKAEEDGIVYTSALRQLVNRMYRDRDYQAKRKAQGQHTAYDYALDRDQRALAWAIWALVRWVPPGEKARAEPPKKARKPSRRTPKSEEQAQVGGRRRGPSWNGQPKRDWAGPELPPS